MKKATNKWYKNSQSVCECVGGTEEACGGVLFVSLVYQLLPEEVWKQEIELVNVFFLFWSPNQLIKKTEIGEKKQNEHFVRGVGKFDWLISKDLVTCSVCVLMYSISIGCQTANQQLDWAWPKRVWVAPGERFEQSKQSSAVHLCVNSGVSFVCHRCCYCYCCCRVVIDWFECVRVRTNKLKQMMIEQHWFIHCFSLSVRIRTRSTWGR